VKQCRLEQNQKNPDEKKKQKEAHSEITRPCTRQNSAFARAIPGYDQDVFDA